jgi:hypothetical protein
MKKMFFILIVLLSFCSVNSTKFNFSLNLVPQIRVPINWGEGLNLGCGGNFEFGNIELNNRLLLSFKISFILNKFTGYKFYYYTIPLEVKFGFKYKIKNNIYLYPYLCSGPVYEEITDFHSNDGRWALNFNYGTIISLKLGEKVRGLIDIGFSSLSEDKENVIYSFLFGLGLAYTISKGD